MESHADETRLLGFLDTLGIAHKTYHHTPVFTVDEAQKARGEMPAGPEHRHSKNLFVRDKKKNYALVVAEEKAPIDLKALADAIGLKRISFASAERLEAYLGVKPGSVTPFAMLNAYERPAEDQPTIRVFIDQTLIAAELAYFHPLHNAATTAIRPADLQAFLAACGGEAEVLNL
ncbi:MAG: prolyl-tRNA synthetase associated domain-containing protein [Kordiimonadaceae bacterium]|nr:prolyl-tRNA synthetase associated domain-containing protein [Kordiimonadaceae bacterium]MBO6568284.1 prolyl-tRNA synthetase associated domain-containing protein [Kordiimonadaceae bacterium]MBO6963986.1 prolyl-tRNA synthetase associated domain-containing protein [Kordiimonadaceae bacterium]